MPGLDGLGLLDRVTDAWPGIPVIIITAHGTVSTAVEALKKGPSTTSRNPSTGKTC